MERNQNEPPKKPVKTKPYIEMSRREWLAAHIFEGIVRDAIATSEPPRNVLIERAKECRKYANLFFDQYDSETD